MKFTDIFCEDKFTPKWEVIETIPEFKRLKDTPQSTVWHKEGDVFKHTKLVTEALTKLINSMGESISDDRKFRLIASALCHDLGKATTTKFDKEKGDYACHNHGAEGVKIMRQLFYDEPNICLLEEVAFMVRYHMTLHHIFDNDDKPTRKMIQLSHGLVTVEDMWLLNKADSLGSVNDIETEESTYERMNKIKVFAEGLNCFTKPYEFKSRRDKLDFFLDKEMKYPKKRFVRENEVSDFNMYVMIGVPGAGKDTYIEKYLKGVVKICRDDIRTEIGIAGEKPQGNKKQEEEVTRIFNERIEKCCRERKSFVLSNTNVKKVYRLDYLNRVKEYMPNIIYVYVNTPIDVCKERRKGQMPLNVIDRMWRDMEFPFYDEMDKFIIYDGVNSEGKIVVDCPSNGTYVFDNVDSYISNKNRDYYIGARQALNDTTNHISILIGAMILDGYDEYDSCIKYLEEYKQVLQYRHDLYNSLIEKHSNDK